jgi:hypothetical protein
MFTHVEGKSFAYSNNRLGGRVAKLDRELASSIELKKVFYLIDWAEPF